MKVMKKSGEEEKVKQILTDPRLVCHKNHAGERSRNRLPFAALHKPGQMEGR